MVSGESCLAEAEATKGEADGAAGAFLPLNSAKRDASSCDTERSASS
jgi:hypothetical protein